MKTRGLKSLIMSIVAVCVSTTSLLGATFAWFTDGVKSGSNVITAGNLDVAVEYTLDGEQWKDLDGATDLFSNGLWEPGHTEVVALKVKNNGSLALRYNAKMNIVKEIAGKNALGEEIILSNILQVSTLVQENNGFGEIALMLAFMGENSLAYEKTAKLSETSVLRQDVQLLPEGEHYVIIKVDMPETVGNEANHNGTDVPSIEFGVNVSATQFNYEQDTFGSDYDKDAEYPAEPEVDYSWYDANEENLVVNSVEQFRSIANLVDGITGEEASTFGFINENARNGIPENWNTTFEGQTVYLNSDIDLYVEGADGEPVCFDPIGSYRKDQAFKGTFDGQGHTISNLYQNTWALNNGYYYGDLGLGLFGLVEDATIKNLVMDNASISGESAICGVVTAVAFGDCTFENITVTNSKCNDYQYYAGGIVGWASGDHVYKNITVDESTVIGGQWGDFGNANGGLIGGIGSSGTYLFEDCTVACVIDAVNDIVSAYQWYCYRNSGMLIGRVPQTAKNGESQTVATPTNVTCRNVTVIYGDWANYTYCEFAGTGYPYVRVQAGVSVDAYSNVRYGHPTDANGNVVVDDNHTHNEGEDHHLLIEFDQLFGGPADARYAYYGIKEFDGVDVIYNNK